MDMYKKREMRKNKKMNEDEKSLPSTNINWEITSYDKPSANAYFTKEFY